MGTVMDLLQQLEKKSDQLQQKIDSDMQAKADLERAITKQVEDLEDTEAQLSMQRKLLNRYSNQLNEGETARNTLIRSGEKFAAAFHKMNKTYVDVDMQ